MAFMLPGYTGEEIKKMQDGRLLIQSVKLSIFSKIFDRKIPALESGALVRRRLLRSQETSNKSRREW